MIKMKVYIPESDAQIEFLKSRGIKEEKFDYHPSILFDKVDEWVDKNYNTSLEVYTYNTLALDFIPKKYLYWVDKRNVIHKFEEKFGNISNYLYAGKTLLSTIAKDYYS